MSETTGPQFINFGSENVNFNSCGKALPGTDMKIENPDSFGVGEIFFRGRNRFMGYFKDEAETLRAIDKNGFIHSGDIGFFDSQSNLIITGRKKELLVTAGGENVAPIPIEDQIKEMSGLISNVIVIGDNRPYLTALLTLKSDSQGSLTEEAQSELNRIFKIDGPSNTVFDLIHDEKVKNYIGKIIEAVNEKAISRAQKIRKWALLPLDFTIETGELTATHKIKRNTILQKYSKYIDGLYSNYKF
jgi:long-chain-fatty-acid--CoA ligase ACSBG